MWLEFLNLLEDERRRLSLTKIGLWGATLVSLTTDFGQILGAIPHDAALTLGVLGANVAAMVKHEVKRWQGCK